MKAIKPWAHLYNRAAWKRLRADQMALEPLCARCEAKGRTVPASVVDHIQPHKGDEARFFDPANLQSLCKPCHDGWKQRVEIGAAERKEFDLSGYPI